MADTQTLEIRVIGGTSQSPSPGLDGCQGFWAHPRPLESAPQGLTVEWGWPGQGVLLGRKKAASAHFIFLVSIVSCRVCV